MSTVERKQERLAHLLEKAQRGDQAALQSLCKELEQLIRGYFWQKFQNHDIVDDLAQETYTRLLKSLPAVQEPMRLRSFVVKVAIHVTQDFLRQTYRKRERALENNLATASNDEGELPEPSEQHDAPDRILSKIDLDQALAQLPEKTRQILLLKADGYKYEEIAAETNLSVSGVKMQIKRSLENLRTLLGNVTFLLIVTTILIKIVEEG
jgi:RNA polymerase sigma-70 factor (ECF subfamily)